LPDWAIGAVFEGAIERDRNEWRRAAYVAYHAGQFGKPSVYREMMEQFEPKEAMTPELAERLIRSMGGSRGE
jgi:hypothetical protein